LGRGSFNSCKKKEKRFGVATGGSPHVAPEGGSDSARQVRGSLIEKRPYNLNFHLFFQGDEQTEIFHRILTVKATKLFYVPHVFEDLPCLIGELVGVGSEDFGDDKGSFPGGCELVTTLVALSEP